MVGTTAAGAAKGGSVIPNGKHGELRIALGAQSRVVCFWQCCISVTTHMFGGCACLQLKLCAGTLNTAIAHIFCAVVGAGVLGLPNSMAWLGWVAGPICIVLFFAVSMWSSHMLARLYCVDGIEFARYHHAVQYILVRWCHRRRGTQG